MIAFLKSLAKYAAQLLFNILAYQSITLTKIIY